MISEDRSNEKYNSSSLYETKIVDKSVKAVRYWLWLMLLIFLVFGSILAIFPSILTSLYTTSPLFRIILLIAEKIGLALLAAAFITIITQLFVLRNYKAFEHELQSYLRESVNTSLSELQGTLKSKVTSIEEKIENSIEHLGLQLDHRTKRLIDQSSALSSLYACSVTNVYQHRRDSAIDMTNDIERGITHLELMGISLNDFVRTGSPLHDVWERIREILDNSTNHDEMKIKIRVLILHPDCLGAELRSIAEHRKGSTIAGRLRQDVKSTAGHLQEIERKTKTNSYIFEARLYTVTPSLFLYRTDFASYVQQYYFWRSRSKQAEVPLFRYGKTQPEENRSIHEQMGDHFDWIWQNSSISLTEFLEGNQTGRDKGLIRAKCNNVYNSTASCKKRMLWLLENANYQVKLIGISLKSFFNEPFYEVLQQIADKGNLKTFQILIIDRDSRQAKFRSYREYLLCGKSCDTGITYDDYRKKSLHPESDLYRDTEASLRKFDDRFAGRQNIEVRIYDCAPSCFALIVDDNAMVEQYHYGKSRSSVDERRILGKDMPVYEYIEEPLFCIERESNIGIFPAEDKEQRRDLEGRKPYELIVDHFNHIWNHYSREFDPRTDLYSK